MKKMFPDTTNSVQYDGEQILTSLGVVHTTQLASQWTIYDRAPSTHRESFLWRRNS
nr:hypothetical protein Iba_scaffold10257CG0010 [Ipomoea batatas]